MTPDAPNIPLGVAVILAAMLLTTMLIRMMHSKTKDQSSPKAAPVRLLYTWARFWWAVAVATEVWHQRFREVNAELKTQIGARDAG